MQYRALVGIDFEGAGDEPVRVEAGDDVPVSLSTQQVHHLLEIGAIERHPDPKKGRK